MFRRSSYGSTNYRPQ